MRPSVGVEGEETAGEDGEEGEEAFFSCHSLRFSLAHVPQELR